MTTYYRCTKCHFALPRFGGNDVCPPCSAEAAAAERIPSAPVRKCLECGVATGDRYDYCSPCVFKLARQPDPEAPPAPDRRNPKDAAGRAKVPLWLLSPVAKAAWCMAQYVGKVKYGAWNWRGTDVLASVYVSAAMRHLDAWLSGETHDPDDGTHHLGNVMACCAILLDAAATGTLIDDRPPRVSHRPAYAEAEVIVAPTEARYRDRNPKHWTIADSVAPDTLASSITGDNHVTAARPVPSAGPTDEARPEDRETGSGETVSDHRV